MKKLRVLLYEEKDIRSWDIDKKGSFFCTLFDKMLDVKGLQSLNGKEDIYERALNDAYYLCTLTLFYLERPYLQMDSLEECISLENQYDPLKQEALYTYTTLVYVVSYVILSHIENYEEDSKISRTVQVLDNNISERDKEQKFDCLIGAMYNIRETLSTDLFKPIELSEDYLSHLDWSSILNLDPPFYSYRTPQFNAPKYIYEIVTTIGRSNKDKLLLIDAIDNYVTEYYNKITNPI